MKIAVITLPLHVNYGGLLQAYALKSVLEELGHTVDVLDLKEKMPVPRGVKAPFIYLSRILKRVLKGKDGPEVFRELRYRRELPERSGYTSEFVRKYIAPRMIDRYEDVREGEYDAIVVGSDQVWRPRYFNGIHNAFLKFAEGWDVRRLSYAASFGTDQLEYEYEQLEECAHLLSCFDAVSVRESSAVKMCAEWFDCDRAVHVLDPVMLADAGRYRSIAGSQNGHPAEGKIMTYILDPCPEKDHVIDFVRKVSGLDPYALEAGMVVPPVEKWLAGFADCEFVVTDSFHGCVLALLMHKRFIAVGNSRRGLSRLHSLLDMFGLDQRLVHGIDPDDDGAFFLSEPDWNEVDKVLNEQKSVSLRFLDDALNAK